MSIVLNQFKPMIYSYFGKETDAVWKTIKNKTKAVKKEFPDIRKDIRMAIYPIAGIYKALLDYVSIDEAKRIMIDYAPTIGNKLRKIIFLGTSFPGVSNYLYLNSRNTYYRVQFEKMIPIIIISTVILTATIIVRVLMQRKEQGIVSIFKFNKLMG